MYEHTELDIQTLKKCNQINLFGDLMTMDLQENIDKISDLYPRRLVNREK